MSTDAQNDLMDQIRQMKAEAEAKQSRNANGSASAAPQPIDNVDAMLARINNLTSQLGNGETSPVPEPPAPSPAPSPPQEVNQSQVSRAAAGSPTQPNDKPTNHFRPPEPKSLREAGLNESAVQELMLKYLLARGEDTGQGIGEQLKLPFPLITELLRSMKQEQLIHYRGTTQFNDYVCSLTDTGRERARRFTERCTYFGTAPVPLSEYNEAIAAQSLNRQSPTEEDLRRAFSDLLINPAMFLRLGSAVNSGKGMFLYGYPGNGKTSIAERITKAFGDTIWIPRTIGIDGEVIRLYDASQHEIVEEEEAPDIVSDCKVDRRWVRIKRPTLVVGGELTMANLELTINEATGINEAPVQLKSNCGTLVIDDFGRQRMSTDELLNRWIVPLEKRYDYLNLPSGKKIEVPFDQLVVFSTNLEPRDLVDDAFLRRIPYKIEVKDPTEKDFVQLFKIMCPIMKLEFKDAEIAYLIEKHYRPTKRPFRCCHPRDLLLQVRNLNKYLKRPMELTKEGFDFAADNYFSIV